MKNKNYYVPLMLIFCLFFLWAISSNLLPTMIRQLMKTCELNAFEASFTETAYWLAYFICPIPIAMFMKKYSYKSGIIFGLLLAACGGLLFFPAAMLKEYWAYLCIFFIIATGMCFLETAANPYVTALGDPKSAPRRLNLAQSFNGLGWICGPLVGGLFLFAADGGSGSVAIPYAIIGILVLLVAIVFSRIHLPEITLAEEPVETANNKQSSLWQHRNFTFGLIALFFYVAAQTGINSFFINYVTEHISISAREAALWLSFVGMGLFMAGRMGGSWLMGFIRAERLLTYMAAGAILAMILVMLGMGVISVGAFFLCFLCESIMFPTIFALAIRGVGEHTKRASSYLIMSIVGGAIAPIIMGYIADTISTATGFIVPLLCFIVILAYAIHLQKNNR